MELTVRSLGDAAEIRVRGRLDNTWSDFFAQRVNQIIAEGSHDLRLDLSEVSFLSSAGIGVLVRCYNQLRGIQGSFVVIQSSPRVSAVLKQVALESVLCIPASARPKTALSDLPRHHESEAAAYDVYELAPAAGLRCRIYGDPQALFNSEFKREACRPLAKSTFALGLGALGSDFDECRDRFGEFLVADCAAAYQPTEGTSTPPDYLVCSGTSAAEVQVLYAVACHGSFQQLLRFEAHGQSGSLHVQDLARECLEGKKAETLGMVIVAEVAGLVGTALRRSPVEAGNGGRFAYPAVREWLSFSPERLLSRTVGLIVGVCTRRHDSKLAPFLRALSPNDDLLGHFHAAAFSYMPIQRGIVQLSETIRHIFESQTLLSVLHLLNDPRLGGAGESELRRGACWISEISDVGDAE